MWFKFHNNYLMAVIKPCERISRPFKTTAKKYNHTDQTMLYDRKNLKKITFVYSTYEETYLNFYRRFSVFKFL